MHPLAGIGAGLHDILAVVLLPLTVRAALLIELRV